MRRAVEPPAPDDFARLHIALRQCMSQFPGASSLEMLSCPARCSRAAHGASSMHLQSLPPLGVPANGALTIPLTLLGAKCVSSLKTQILFLLMPDQEDRCAALLAAGESGCMQCLWGGSCPLLSQFERGFVKAGRASTQATHEEVKHLRQQLDSERRAFLAAQAIWEVCSSLNVSIVAICEHWGDPLCSNVLPLPLILFSVQNSASCATRAGAKEQTRAQTLASMETSDRHVQPIADEEHPATPSEASEMSPSPLTGAGADPTAPDRPLSSASHAPPFAAAPGSLVGETAIFSGEKESPGGDSGRGGKEVAACAGEGGTCRCRGTVYYGHSASGMEGRAMTKALHRR